jgi:hypothetical protein
VFGSVILEVFLGLVLFYAWFSLACSALTEFLESVRAQRGKQLALAIAGMLGNEMSGAFYQHGLIRSFSKGQRLPSYVPSHSFALVTLELLGIDASNYRERVFLVQGCLGETLRTLQRTSATYEGFLLSIERWFEATMERCAGWFRRRARWASFVTSFLMAVALNVDSIEIANRLYSDNLLRLTMVTEVERVGNGAFAPSPSGVTSTPAGAREMIGLPIGWENSRLLTDRSRRAQGFVGLLGPLLSKLFGLLATALAGSMGAAFWFDALNRTMMLKSRFSQRSGGQRSEVPPIQPQVVTVDPARVVGAAPAVGIGPRTSAGIATDSVGIAVSPIVGVGPVA